MGWFPGALVSAGGRKRRLALESYIGRKLEQQAALRCARGPAARLAYRSVGEAMERRWAMASQCFEMLRGAITFVLREAVLRIEPIELLHPSIALDLGQDRSRGNRNRARVAMDQRPLL